MNLATPAPAPTRAPVNNLNRANPLLYVVLIVVGVIALAPFVWMLLSSIKSFGDFSFVDFSNLKNIGKSFWPWPPFGDSSPAFGNFAEAMDRIDRSSDYKTLTGIPLFARQFINTLGISVVTVFGVLTTSALAAYAFAMLEFPGRNILFVIVLITLMIPNGGDIVVVQIHEDAPRRNHKRSIEDRDGVAMRAAPGAAQPEIHPLNQLVVQGIAHRRGNGIDLMPAVTQVLNQKYLEDPAFADRFKRNSQSGFGQFEAAGTLALEQTTPDQPLRHPRHGRWGHRQSSGQGSQRHPAMLACLEMGFGQKVCGTRGRGMAVALGCPKGIGCLHAIFRE